MNILNLSILLSTLFLLTESAVRRPNYAACSFFNSTASILNTLNGKVQGACYNVPIYHADQIVTKSNPILTWLAVPYANPPVGSLRFKSPQPVKSWTKTLNGLNYPNSCIQPTWADPTSTSEDCLYLNIHTPYASYVKSVMQRDTSSLLPIYVWIHGGAFSLGAGSFYDGFQLSALSNVIFVAINYRLGSFGFMYVNGTDAQGNQALRDQNQAFKWIYNNAARFGGDNKRITIGGQSAGSWSVGYHLIYKDSWPYFRNAILESGNPVTLDIGTLLLQPSEANSLAIYIGSTVNCSNLKSSALLTCLQKKSVTDINTASSSVQLFPTFVSDANIFDKRPRTLFATGKFKQCNILAGSNTYEELSLASDEIGQYITDLARNDLNTLRTALMARLIVNATVADKIISFYKPASLIAKSSSVNFYIVFIDMITDYQYRCPTMQLAEYYSVSKLSAYIYSYAYRSSRSQNQPVVDGASHSDELEMVFGDPLTDSTSYTANERALSEQMIKYWGSFISDNKMPDSRWNKFNSLNSSLKRSVLSLKANKLNNTVYSINDPICTFWNNLLY